MSDRYGRLLRYVWVPTGGGDGKGFLLNERLVREGYAVLYTYPPDVGYVERIRAAQQAAQGEQAGLWRGCGGADTPAEEPPPTASSGSTEAPTPKIGADTGGDRDCSDFAARQQTRTSWTATAMGVVCESLP